MSAFGYLRALCLSVHTQVYGIQASIQKRCIIRVHRSIKLESLEYSCSRCGGTGSSPAQRAFSGFLTSIIFGAEQLVLYVIARVIVRIAPS